MEKSQPNSKSYSRFRFVSKPLTAITDNDEIRKPDFPFSQLLSETKYPIRALRYWWMHCVIEEEVNHLNKPVVIADVGCDNGIIKRFIPPVKDSRWIAFDINTSRLDNAVAKYDEVYHCDFDVKIPAPDSSVDIAICSHVFEHLPRPEFTMSELARILRPGGMLLVGTPVAPKFIARFREMQFARQMQSGTRKHGQHVNMFWVKRLHRLAVQAGLKVEFSAGTAMIRKKGSRLENYALWVRINQVWAAMFPSLGQELCVQIRKPL